MGHAHKLVAAAAVALTVMLALSVVAADQQSPYASECAADEAGQGTGCDAGSAKQAYGDVRTPLHGKEIVVDFPPRGPVKLPKMTFKKAKAGDTVCRDISIDVSKALNDDMLLLTDATGSMSDLLGTVQKELSKLMELRGKKVRTRWAVASYKDESEYSFKLHQPMTSVRHKVQKAIDGLRATGGGDWPEANLVALYNAAMRNDIGWKDYARRLVVWFGDAIGHEPTCPYPGLRLRRGDVLQHLKDARISVIGVSDSGGLDHYFNGKTNSYGKCDPPTNGPILANQGSTLALGTLGQMFALEPGAGTVVSELLDIIDGLEIKITSELRDCEGVFTVSYTPSLPKFLMQDDTLNLKQCITVDREACENVGDGGYFSCDVEVLATGAAFAVRPLDLEELVCWT